MCTRHRTVSAVWFSHVYKVWDSVCLLSGSVISVNREGWFGKIFSMLTENNKISGCWTMLYFCFKVVDCRGDALLPYVATLQLVMDRTLHLTCREGYLSSSSILCHILFSLTSVTPVEYCSVPGFFNKPIKDYLPMKVWMLCPLFSLVPTSGLCISLLCWQDWGKPGNPYKMQLKWYVPGNNEVACVQSLINRYLPPEVQHIESFICDEVQLTR